MISAHRKTGALCSAGAAAVLLAAFTAGASAATTVICNPTKVKASVSVAVGETTSLSFVNLADAKFSFTQGGSGASCVLVRFSAVTYAETGTAVFVRATLDNTAEAIPAQVQYSGNDGNAARAHSYEFVFPAVAPGSHTLRMQFRSAE